MTKESGMEGRDFSRLLQESLQLNARIRAGGHDNVFLPQLQRGLEQIEELSNQLAAKVVAAGEARQVESKAALFLAARGYDVTLVSTQLRKVADIVPGPVSQAAVAFDADVDGFLQSELDNAVLGTLDRIEKLVVEEAEKILEARRKEAWGKGKAVVVEERRQLQVGQDYVTGNIKLPSGPKVATYARVIRIFNEARLKGSSICLARDFEAALRELEGTDPRGQTLIDCWRAIQFIMNTEDSDNVFETRDFSASYLANSKTAESKLWKSQLVCGSRRFLEDMYIRFVDRTLAQYPRDAMLGGRPSALERVRAFSEIKLKRMPPAELTNVEMINGSAIWMILFILVRCGLLKDALSMAQTMEHLIQRNDPLFFGFFKAFVIAPNNQITGNLLGQLRLEYSQRITAGKQDPYKMAILKIIGRCDLSRKTIPDVTVTSEDYLWLQFWLVQDSLIEESEGGAAYTLADLQRTITDFGPNHFDPKQSNPWQYYNILLLVGLFESAVEYLYQQGQQIDAVHFSLVFIQAGTFRTGRVTDPLFIKQGPQGTIVNFGALVSSYASSLGTGDINDAVNYLLLLSLDKKGEYNDLCHKAVRDLILKSGDYGALLGDVRHDGSVMPGTLSQYARLMNLRDAKSFMDVITAAAAEKCDQEGRFREALQLYNLANKYDRVVDVLCTRLCRAFVGPYVALEGDELRRTAESILSYYTSHGHISSSLSPASRNTCATLIQLLSVRKSYEEMKWAECLESLLKLSFLPIEGDVAAISSAADRVRDMPDSLTIILPELLLIAMGVIMRRNGELKGYIGIDSGRAQQSDLLKRMARNLMTFLGMLHLRIPQEIYAQLTKMEISMD